MQIKHFNSTIDSEHGYSANIDAVVSRPLGEVEITIHVNCSDGNPEHLPKVVIGMVEELALTLLDAQDIDRRAEDF